MYNKETDMENKEGKMIKVNAWIGVENLEAIEAALEDRRYKYSMILEAMLEACKKKGLGIVSQKIAVNQNYKSLCALIEVHGDGEYNPVLGFQMNWGSLNVKAKWGCHFKEDDIYAFPVAELERANPFLNGVTAIVDDVTKWQAKIEETFEYLNEVKVSRTDIWNTYMFQIAYILEALPSSQVIQTMKEWDESGEMSLYSFYMVLCQKLSKKEPNALFSYNDKLLKSNYFTLESPVRHHSQKEDDEVDYEPINEEPSKVNEADRETEAIERGVEEEEEGLLLAGKYL